MNANPQPDGSLMTPVLLRTMLVAYVTARRAGPTPIDKFLALFPDAAGPERELLVSLNCGLVEAEMAGEDMDAVFDDLEVSIGAQLIREIQRGVNGLGGAA